MDDMGTGAAAGQEIPSPATLVERAKELIPTLRERADECETQRRMPDETFQDFRKAGILNVVKAKDFGGYEMGWDVFCEISMELAKGCGSSAWVYAVLGEHAHTVCTYPMQAQHDVWTDDPDTQVASGNSPNCKMERTDGGWLITGQFNYSSGCDHADWHLTGMPVDGQPLKILVPQAGCEIVDNWHVMGLAGTGSKDIKLEKVFIPDHRTIPIGERGPRFDDAALFRLPQWSVNPFCLASVVVGVAEGAVERFTEEMKERSSRFGAKIAEFQSLQLRIAESAAELHAARLMILNDLRETMEYFEDNEEPDFHMLARNKRDMAYAPILASKAMERIFYAAGANGLFLDNDIQRSFRDVNAGSKQIALNFDINGTTYGKIALGLDPAPVRW